MSRVSYSRRQFLKCASAAAATTMVTPMVIPAAALGRGLIPAPSERIAMAMIGTGRQAYIVNMERQLLQMPDVQIVALCDVDRWRLEQAEKLVEQKYAQRRSAGQFQEVDLCGDYREILDRDDVDAVMISTPDHWHAPMAIAAANKGKHVALEKPITRTVAQGQAIIDAMRQSPCISHG